MNESKIDAHLIAMENFCYLELKEMHDILLHIIKLQEKEIVRLNLKNKDLFVKMRNLQHQIAVAGRKTEKANMVNLYENFLTAQQSPFDIPQV